MDNSLMHKPVICCVGASHKSAPSSFREAVYVEAERLQVLLGPLSAKHGFDELIVLSTCNRFEIYALALQGRPSEEALRAAYHDLQVMAGQAELAPRQLIDKHTYFFHDLSAIEHIFAVACSLDSLVVGETQITGQFKEALLLAGEAGTLGTYLDRLAQEVLATAKKVRTRTRIGEKTVSISHAAIDLAKRVFRDIGEHSFLLIGAGEMAEVAALYARNYNPRQIYIANRTLAHAHALVDKLGMGEAHSMDDLAVLLEKADIVISSTASLHPVITYPFLREVMRQRRGRPLFLVDIAIPRDIESLCGKLDDVYLFEIDDLRKVVDDNLEERRLAADEARAFVKSGAALFERWLANVAVKPILANFREYLNDLTGREIARTLGRDLYKDLSEQQVAGLQNMLQSIAGKLVGDAGRAINNPDEALRDQLALALRLMFSRVPAPAERLRPALAEKGDVREQKLIRL